MATKNRSALLGWLAAGAIGLISVVAGMASAQPAKGERVPVSYLVARSAFRAVERGQQITFELHQGPDCGEALDSEVVTVGADPDFLVEGVASRALDPAVRSPRRPIRLRYVMEPTSSAGRLYLRVTGPGVEPVGAECQAQEASIREGGALSCASVSSGISGAVPPYTATATCPPGTVRTGGGHSGVSASDVVLSSQADDANGWFCSVAGAAAAGACQATCCHVE